MPLNNDFPVPLTTFGQAIIRSPDAVWLKFMQAQHGGERHTEQRWQEILVSYRDDTPLAPEEPATPGVVEDPTPDDSNDEAGSA